MTDDQTSEEQGRPEDEEMTEGQAPRPTEEEASEAGEREREELVAEPAGVGEPPPSPTEAGVVKRRPVTIAITLLVVLAIVAIAVWAVMNARRPEARELLQQAIANYEDATHIHVESTMSYEMSMGEQTDDARLATTAWFSRPNSMFFETGDENNTTTAVSDGENL
ncbi:MAG: LolA family protein, partial [Armatimonadota bacterium]